MTGSTLLVVIGFSTFLVPLVEASDVIYAATSNGVFKTTDGGTSWTPSNTGLSGVNVFSLAIDPLTPTTVYAGTFGHRVFKSTDAGQHWLPASTGFGDDTALLLTIAPLNPATIYAGTTGTTTSAFFPGSSVFKSSNGAAVWIAANSGLPRAIVNAIAIDPSNPAVLYAGTNAAGVFKSTDGGTHWVSTNAGLADDLQVVALAIDPTNTRVLYAGTRFNGIFKSTDAGARWSSINPAPTGTMFAIVHFSLVADPVNAGTVYAGTFDGVFKSTDGGKNWTAANSGLPASSRIFALALHAQRLSR